MDRLVTQCRPKNRIVMHRKSKGTENQILPYNFTNADNYSLQLLEEKNARSTQTLTDAKLHQIRPLKHTQTLVKKWEEIEIKKIRKRSMWLRFVKKRACCRSLPQRNGKTSTHTHNVEDTHCHNLVPYYSTTQSNRRNLNAPRKHTNNTTGYYCKQKMAWHQECCDIRISVVD
jgi:hypothetical protein